MRDLRTLNRGKRKVDNEELCKMPLTWVYSRTTYCFDESYVCNERRHKMKNRRPCIHGDLCRGIYKLTGRIYSVRCPYGCKFYEPVKGVEKGDVE